MSSLKWSNIESVFKLSSDFETQTEADCNRVKLMFECLLCLPMKIFISCDSSSLTKLKRHVSCTHPSQVSLYNTLYQTKRRSSNEHWPPANQSKIDPFVDNQHCLRPVHVSQKQLDTLIFRHIIDDGQALTLVRSESFRNLILRLAPKRHIML